MSDTLDLLQALIRNACVNDGTVSSGNEERSVSTLADFFGRSGEVFEPAPGRQSVVYRVQGSNPDAPSLVLAPHLDVVPADPHGWTVDPFAAEIVDGFVFGRGAVDMLNITAAMATAFRPYLHGEAECLGDLVFCALADEEAGGRFGAAALTEERWDLVGGDFLLTEVAYPGIPAGDHRRVPICIGEKGAFWSILRAEGTPGHGSAPFGSDNAIVKLVDALAGVVDTPAPAEIDPLWEGFVKALDLGEDAAERLVDVDLLDAAIDEIAAGDPDLARYVHAATHLTISVNMVDGGSKANVVPDSAEATLDIRSLPGMDRHYVDGHLRKAMGMAADRVSIEPIMDGDANLSPADTKLWAAIADTVEDIEGHRDVVPTMTTVSTDARFWRERGTVSYGVGMFDERMGFSEMLSLFHGHDEKVSVASVDRTAVLYQGVLARFFEK